MPSLADVSRVVGLDWALKTARILSASEGSAPSHRYLGVPSEGRWFLRAARQGQFKASGKVAKFWRGSPCKTHVIDLKRARRLFPCGPAKRQLSSTFTHKIQGYMTKSRKVYTAGKIKSVLYLLLAGEAGNQGKAKTSNTTSGRAQSCKQEARSRILSDRVPLPCIPRHP